MCHCVLLAFRFFLGLACDRFATFRFFLGLACDRLATCGLDFWEGREGGWGTTCDTGLLFIVLILGGEGGRWGEGVPVRQVSYL